MNLRGNPTICIIGSPFSLSLLSLGHGNDLGQDISDFSPETRAVETPFSKLRNCSDYFWSKKKKRLQY